jgi:nucleotide-binding universal stress UspA family protein
MADTTIPVPSRSLLVRSDGELQFGKILVPVDFSIGTATQLRVARELARTSNGTLVLLHVREPFFDPGGMLEPGTDDSDFHLMLEAIKLDLTRAGFNAESHCVKGSPGPEIVAMAEGEGADLVVMGTHGRKGLKHVLMGSVAEHVVRKARCPVLTLRLEDVEHSHGSAS